MITVIAEVQSTADLNSIGTPICKSTQPMSFRVSETWLYTVDATKEKLREEDGARSP